jgi:hypothetical protein
MRFFCFKKGAATFYNVRTIFYPRMNGRYGPVVAYLVFIHTFKSKINQERFRIFGP